MQPNLLLYEASQSFGIWKKREVVYIKLKEFRFNLTEGAFRALLVMLPLQSRGDSNILCARRKG
jgi:hypothetical protein